MRRALVIVLRASEYSSWMALIRPGSGGEESWSTEWGHPNPGQARGPNGPLMHHPLENLHQAGLRHLLMCGLGPSAHLYSRGTWPTHCCWPALGTRTWTPVSQPGRTSCSVGNSAAGGSAGWPAHLRHAEASLSGAEHARSFKKERRKILKASNHNSLNCL